MPHFLIVPLNGPSDTEEQERKKYECEGFEACIVNGTNSSDFIYRYTL
jgi:hypothetical protein